MIKYGPYPPASRGSYQSLCLTRRRCTFDRTLGALDDRRYNYGVKVVYVVELYS